MSNDGLQLSKGMYIEGNSTIHNAANSVRRERTDGKIQFIGNAVNHVAQQVEAVNGQNLDGYRIEYGRAFLVVNGHDGVALL